MRGRVIRVGFASKSAAMIDWLIIRRKTPNQMSKMYLCRQKQLTYVWACIKLLTASCNPTKDCMLLEKVLSSTLTSAAGVLVRIRHVVAVGVEVQALQRLPARVTEKWPRGFTVCKCSNWLARPLFKTLFVTLWKHIYFRIIPMVVTRSGLMPSIRKGTSASPKKASPASIGSKWNAVCCFSCSALMKKSDLECQRAGSFSRNFPPCKTKHVSVWALKAPPGECEMPATWNAIISCSWRRLSEFHSFYSAEVRGWSLSLAPILALAKPWDDCCRTAPAKRCQLGRVWHRWKGWKTSHLPSIAMLNPAVCCFHDFRSGLQTQPTEQELGDQQGGEEKSTARVDST